MRIVEVAVSDEVNILRTYYDQIRVYKASSETGSYSFITSVNLAASQYIYPVVDNDGLPGDWYKYTLYKSSAPTAETNQTLVPQFYCSVSSLKARLNETGTSTDLIFIDAVASATQFVREHCRREFYQRTEIRYFEGTGPEAQYTNKRNKILWIDDVISVSKVEVDYSAGVGGASPTTLTLNTHCYLWPQTAPQRDFPFEGVEWIQNANYPLITGNNPALSGLYWPQGYKAIRITGTWGWPLQPLTNSPVPAPVRDAALQVAARIYKGRDNAYSRVAGNSEIGSFPIREKLIDTEIQKLLQSYVKPIGT